MRPWRGKPPMEKNASKTGLRVGGHLPRRVQVCGVNTKHQQTRVFIYEALLSERLGYRTSLVKFSAHNHETTSQERLD